MQTPNNDPNQQLNFYGDQTQFYPQPGAFAPPPPVQPKKPNIWQRYRRLNIFARIGMGCLGAVLILFICVCSLGAIAGPPKTTANQGVVITTTATAALPTEEQPSPTMPQASPTQIQPTSTAIPTDTPTPTPIPLTPTQMMPTPQQTQASVATPTPVAVQATQPPAPTPTPVPQHVGVNNNPWGYDFVSPGNVITSPPAEFCSYFACIPNFVNGKGYVVQCQDNMYSKSGGAKSGVCSYHGGYKQTLYSH